jgi:Histidinol phosphatase and related hydrolases of the PHP family
MVDNYFIADQFSLLAKLMDMHGENSFRSRTYSNAAFAIEKITEPLAELPEEKLFTIKGIGDSIGKKIIEMRETGRLRTLEEYIEKTPPGVLEMLNIKGLGPKKIATIWKEMGIESVGELLYACNENRLLLYKGFGEKTQLNVQESIEFYMRNQGSHLYSETEAYARAIDQTLKKQFPDRLFALTGPFRRQAEIIDRLEWVTTANQTELLAFLGSNNYTTQETLDDIISVLGPENVAIKFYITTEAEFYSTLFSTTGNKEFVQACQALPGWNNNCRSEEELFTAMQLPYIPPAMREDARILNKKIPSTLIQPGDIRGIIHSHSQWSDGLHSIEDMAKACIDKGMEYLVISDHSKTAVYAKGLTEERIREQHAHIDELNKKLKPFKIFKSIECDILNDGALDYSNNVLSTFDLVIASVHQNLKMSEDKAMMRLLNAIRNPYTTILGHMTGRLLLSRPGYPVDHVSIIDACVENQVVIELNAHPRRLDIDWRWIDYALEKGVLISIDPDAHSVDAFDDCRYGVLAAQKGGLTKEQNLSSFTQAQLEDYLQKRRAAKGI